MSSIYTQCRKIVVLYLLCNKDVTHILFLFLRGLMTCCSFVNTQIDHVVRNSKNTNTSVFDNKKTRFQNLKSCSHCPLKDWRNFAWPGKKQCQFFLFFFCRKTNSTSGAYFFFDRNQWSILVSPNAILTQPAQHFGPRGFTLLPAFSSAGRGPRPKPSGQLFGILYIYYWAFLKKKSSGQ